MVVSFTLGVDWNIVSHVSPAARIFFFFLVLFYFACCHEFCLLNLNVTSGSFTGNTHTTKRRKQVKSRGGCGFGGTWETIRQRYSFRLFCWRPSWTVPVYNPKVLPTKFTLDLTSRTRILLRSKTGVRGFYCGVSLEYAIFIFQAKPVTLIFMLVPLVCVCIPAGAAGEFSSPELTCRLQSHFTAMAPNEVGVGWLCRSAGIVCEPIRKRAHTQLVRERSSAVVSARWATVDRTWPKVWN